MHKNWRITFNLDHIFKDLFETFRNFEEFALFFVTYTIIKSLLRETIFTQNAMLYLYKIKRIINKNKQKIISSYKYFQLLSKILIYTH